MALTELGWGGCCGGEELRSSPDTLFPLSPPTPGLLVEPDRQKAFHYGELTLIGALRPLSLLYSAKLPRLRLGEGQATLPFVNTLPYLRHPVSGSHLPLNLRIGSCSVQS